MKSRFNIWEGTYRSFQEASADKTGPGFNGEIWQSRTLESANECLSAIERGIPIPAFYKQRSTLLATVAGMMLDQRDCLDILDFGGGLGIGYMSLMESIPLY